MMGIGRPALSNFLNGKAKLSQAMATRLAKAFDVDKSQLLMMQQEYELSMNKESEKKIAVRSYAPAFLNIRAKHIDTWAQSMDARSLLPALLRRLVNSTGAEISHSDFPAYDNSERKGWDGRVESENVTPWVPHGISGWEFSCNKNPTSKANSDYEKRTQNTAEEERENTTFIFVTPHNWSSKENWIKAKKEKDDWKDVRAYDANDLEQWLELSVSGQVWLADKIGIPQGGCRTLDDYWNFWSETADPPISQKIFDSAVSSYGNTIVNWYQNPAEKPLVVTASSIDEAKAFLACVAGGVEVLNRLSEQAVLVSDGDVLNRLAAITTEFIPITYTQSAEKELVARFNNRPAIVVTEKGLKGTDPDITVELPSYESFRDAMTDMGFDDAQRKILSSQSGESPTILRRQLATSPALKKPAWATSSQRIQMMIPLTLAGTWKSNEGADQEILKILADDDYTNIERNIAGLVGVDDAPIWSEGKYRGVVSRLDCIHAISDQITEADLDRFFFVAEYVLSEDDPALDLDKAERWRANIYNKVRDHSKAIRKGICDNLIVLSVHGDSLFGRRLDINIESRVAVLVRKLLEDQSSRVWQSQQDDLPRYAEAAPDEFLDIVEFELAQENPAFATLFEPVDGGPFSHCERTGMLWALELLAWDSTRLSRVATVLARLCQYKLEDNWANRPIGSLGDIFLSRMPHTAATIEQRCEVLELICRRYPDVGWAICMSELKPFPKYTSGTYRPQWRSDASGAGQNVTQAEYFEFLKKCQELVLSWQAHSQATLCDLIDCLSGMGNEEREIVTNQIKIWLDSCPSDEDILRLREHVRVKTMTEKAKRRNKDEHAYANGKKIYDLLEPKEVILKHQWLFAKQWVEYTPEELEDDNLNHEARGEKISRQRILALKEVLEIYGIDGAIELCLNGETGFAIGCHLTRDIMDEEEIQDVIVKCLSTGAVNDHYRIDSCLSGILHQLNDSKGRITLENLLKQFTDRGEGFDNIIRLFINAPFKRSTWELLQTHHEQVQKTYWKKISPYWGDHPPEDFNFLIEQLLNANRPRAAFEAVHFKLDLIKSALLIRLLNEIATNASEPDSHFPRQHNIEEAFNSLNKRDDVKRSELSRLEYLYVQVLTPFSEYGIPNLSKDIAESPVLFMQLLAMCFGRKDDGKDPEEWNLPTEPEHRKQAGTNAYYALEHLNVIPGSQDDGTIDIEQLRNWIIEARRLAKTYGRTNIGDQRIGQILSNSDVGADGIWPREEVRQVFEEIASEHISLGMEVGLYNSGGRVMRPIDEARERALADKYRNFAERVRNKTPFVGRMLLRIAKSYEYDADRYVTDDRVQRRLED